MLHRTGGVWTFPLDDTYIHLALARNLADHGTWGIQPDTYAPASSSPLYTLLLALFFRAGGWGELGALGVNLLAALGLVGLIAVFWPHPPSSRRGHAASLLLVLGIPLPLLVLIGMEHTLHTLLMLLFWIRGVEALTHPERMGEARIYALLAGGVRYESLFLGATLILALLSRRRVRDALLLGLSVGAVPLAYGIVNLLHGWPILPTTLLLKGTYWGDQSGVTYLGSLLTHTFHTALRAPEIPLLAAGQLWLARWGRGEDRQRAWTFAGTALLHLAFAQVGWLFRYEGYLIALGWWGVAHLLVRRLPPRESLLGFGLGVMLLPRAYGMALLPAASQDIHDLPLQSARFLATLPPGTPVALWDIGLPAFRSGVRVLDVVGLAHRTSARLRLSGKEEEILCTLAREGARVAVVYDSLFPYASTQAYPVGYWEVPPETRTVAGWYRMTVYALQPEDTLFLRRRFVAFARRFLPPRVRWGTQLPPPSTPCFPPPIPRSVKKVDAGPDRHPETPRDPRERTEHAPAP